MTGGCMVGFLAVWLGLCAVSAQQAKPQFEVASVKPQLKPLGPATMNRAFPSQVRPGRVFNPTHSSVYMLMLFAYDIQTVQLSGGPDWIREDRFEINATAGRDVTTAETRLMVQSLLEDRFGLRTHSEQRDLRHLGLVLVRGDRRTGPYLRPIDNCEPDAIADARKKLPPAESAGSGRLSGCGAVQRIAGVIAAEFETPIVDETGLKGTWLFQTTHSGWPNQPAGSRATAVDSAAPSLSAALEEQLGLKLEQRRGPITVLVIDAVHKPTEN